MNDDIFPGEHDDEGIDMQNTFGYFMKETNKRLDQMQADHKEFVSNFEKRIEMFGDRMEKKLELLSTSKDVIALRIGLEKHDVEIDRLKSWKNYIAGGMFVAGAVAGAVVGVIVDLIANVWSHR